MFTFPDAVIDSVDGHSLRGLPAGRCECEGTGAHNGNLSVGCDLNNDVIDRGCGQHHGIRIVSSVLNHLMTVTGFCDQYAWLVVVNNFNHHPPNIQIVVGISVTCKVALNRGVLDLEQFNPFSDRIIVCRDADQLRLEPVRLVKYKHGP